MKKMIKKQQSMEAVNYSEQENTIFDLQGVKFLQDFAMNHFQAECAFEYFTSADPAGYFYKVCFFCSS